MYFNPVGCHAGLPMQEIKHRNSFYLHRHVDVLEAGTRSKGRVKFSAGLSNGRRKWAGCTNTIRRRDFSDHGIAGIIADAWGGAGIILGFELDQGGVNCPTVGSVGETPEPTGIGCGALSEVRLLTVVEDDEVRSIAEAPESVPVLIDQRSTPH